jgi:hypothetical protein
VSVDTKHHLIVGHIVTNDGSDRDQLRSMAKLARSEMAVYKLHAVADRGYYKSEGLCQVNGEAAVELCDEEKNEIALLDVLAQKRRQGRGQAILPPGAAIKPGAAQDCYRPATPLSGGEADIPELAQVQHVCVKTAARVNNRAGNSHRPTRRRERQMCGFRDARRTQAFLSCFGPTRQQFALPRHQMSAACHRATLKEHLVTSQEWTVSTAANQVN